jgi:hypothetical protein
VNVAFVFGSGIGSNRRGSHDECLSCRFAQDDEWDIYADSKTNLPLDLGRQIPETGYNMFCKAFAGENDVGEMDGFKTKSKVGSE